MREPYNSNEDLSYNMYFVLNNMYSSSMSELLPYDQMKLLGDRPIQLNKLGISLPTFYLIIH